MFIIKFNGVCMRPPNPRPMSGNRGFQEKYIDDCTQAASVNMRVSLIPDFQEIPRPLSFHERTQMVLNPEEDILQQEMRRFNKEALENRLAVNQKNLIL